MRHGSLFSGIGGFDLAASWMNWTNVFQCEIDPFCRKVLKYHFPNCIQHEDIRTTDFRIYRGRIDIITGGFPCQPYSAAGKRKGKEDERHLWPEMLRAIREIQPSWIVGENVFGLINWSGGLVFHEVQSDLETEGYEVFPYVLPACAKNAPHRRDRVWFVAYTEINGDRGRLFGMEEAHDRIRQSEKCRKDNSESWYYGKERNVTNSDNEGVQGRSSSGYLESERKISEQFSGRHYQFNNWNEFPTQSAICNGDDGIPTGLDIDAISFNKWRTESIKSGGNAVVPQVVYEIFQAIEKLNSEPNAQGSIASKAEKNYKS